MALKLDIQTAAKCSKKSWAGVRLLLDQCAIVCNTAHMKRRTNLMLEDRQKKALKELSAKTGAPISELVRRAIDAYLKKRAK